MVKRVVKETLNSLEAPNSALSYAQSSHIASSSRIFWGNLKQVFKKARNKER